jgi:hypothetical protein
MLSIRSNVLFAVIYFLVRIEVRLDDSPLLFRSCLLGDGADQEVHLHPSEEVRQAEEALFEDLHYSIT